MIKFSKIFFAVFLLVALSACAHKNRVLFEPAPITVIDQSIDVKRVVKGALSEFGWRILSDTKGQIIAQQVRGAISAKIRINYTQKEVKISYVDSTNLRYRKDEDGVDRIHGRYNTWVTNLERSIAAHLY